MEERVFLRHVIAEGVCALADFYEKTGRLVLPFRFEVCEADSGRAPEFERIAAAEQAAVEEALKHVS